MRKVTPLLAVMGCVVLLALAWLIAGRYYGLAPSIFTPKRIQRPTDQQTSAMTNPERAMDKTEVPPSDSTTTLAPKRQTAFRFILSEGKIALEAVDNIQGDFHQRRGEMEWESGMFYCRLLDAQNRVLAEETLMAPDHVCVVLDPHTPGEDGEPQPVRLSPTGPVVFQVRMPGGATATHMKIYRIQQGPRPATPNDEPEGELLATIPLVP